MKIVFNTDQIYLHGGIEKVMTTKANYLATLPGIEVYIVTTEQQGNPPCYALDGKIQLIDLEVNYDRSHSYLSGENIRKAYVHFKRQKALFRKLKPDWIISSNLNFDHYWLPFIQRSAQKIKELHSSRYNWKPTLWNRLNAWFEKKYDHIVVLNKDEAKYIHSDKVVVIPNPIEKQMLRADLDLKQVIAAGRIAPVKGFDELITAWALVHQTQPDWQLHIYGQDYGGTQVTLQQQIEQAGLQNVVLFKGNVDDLPRTMSEYSIYAMSSMTECFPMVLLEALSVGLPIVSYDCPHGPRNIIPNNQGGLLIQNQNPQDLGNGLLQLINDKTLRKSLADQGHNRSVQYEVNTIMKKWLTLFAFGQ